MTEMVLTRKTFIGQGAAGRLAYPGEVVDVDEKGVPAVAGSTPVGNMTDDMLEAELERRRKANGKAEAREPDYGSNVAEPTDGNTGEQRLEIAKIRPGDGVNPQGLPPGTEPVGDRFIRRAPEGADAAIEVVVGTGAEEGVVADGSAFDHDKDGNVGGSTGSGEKSLSRMNKAELLAAAKERNVDVSDDDTNAVLIEKIEKARNDA